MVLIRLLRFSIDSQRNTIFQTLCFSLMVAIRLPSFD